jgi:hypothetical protein
VLLVSLGWGASVQAQGRIGGWSEPYRLSSPDGRSSEATLVADAYGFVHCFWVEVLQDNRSIIQYARFDGVSWSPTVDIYLSGPYAGTRSVSAAVDSRGGLHLAWAEGLTADGPVYTMSAPAHDALSAQHWSEPIPLGLPADSLELRVDSRGVYHLVYADHTAEAGVYYVRSEDQGVTWSKPFWLDPDILPGHVPDSLNFDLDDAGGLHAVWFYGAIGRDAQPDWVRYAHSLDGGRNWSKPFMIDRAVPETEHNLTVAGPKMIVQGQTVHVIWAAGSLPYRQHRYSTDAGRTWTKPRQIFDELHGQAFDGLTVDGAGRLHFVGQIRFPVGIYHAIFDGSGWTQPSLVYLIAQGDETIEEHGERVHAHHTHPAVGAGNQLVITFGDGPADPNRRLFAMHRTLSELPSLELLPTPVPSATPSPPPTVAAAQPTPRPTRTPTTPLPPEVAARPLDSGAGPDLALSAALVPAVLILGYTFTRRWLSRPRTPTRPGAGPGRQSK